jgi:orotate phosphoribosyltransferase
MDQSRAITLLKSSEALLEGHFLLSSGNHSEQYIQCAALLARPELALEFMEDIAGQFKEDAIDVVVSPAVGGVIVSYEIARLLGKRALFLEREDGIMTLRRGFKINEGDNVIIVEDVITTGGSVFEVQEAVEKSGGLVKAFASIVNRSTGRFTPGVPYYSCIEMDIPIFKPELCPLCKDGTPLVKPGSKNLN